MISPTVKLPLSKRLTAYLLGRGYPGWMASQVKGERVTPFAHELGTFASSLGVSRIFQPNPHESNALLCRPDELTDVVSLNGVSLCWGVRADGITNLKKGEAFYIVSADCPTVVLYDGEGVTPFHAGRDCLVVRPGRGEATRPSVVTNALALFPDAAKVSAWILCGVGDMSYPHRLDDPAWGESNIAFLAQVEAQWGPACVKRNVADPQWRSLALRPLISEQLRRSGVSSQNIKCDGIDTAEDDRWWSCVAGRSTGRNGILIVAG